MRSVAVSVLCLTVAFFPVAVNAAEVAQAETLLSRIHLSDTARADPSEVRSADIQLFERNGAHVLETDVTAGAAHAHVSWNGRDLAFGDGYTVSREVLVDNPAEHVAKLTAHAPDGAHAVATIRYNRVIAQGESNGMERVYTLLSQSTQFNVVAQSLPFLIGGTSAFKKSATASSSNNTASRQIVTNIEDYPIESDGWIYCALAITGWVLAAVAMVVACGAPVVDLIACLPAIAAFAGAGIAVGCECSGYDC